MLPTLEGCYNLLEAIGRQWLRDALQDKDDLAALAWWLSTTPDELSGWVADPTGPHAAYNLALPRACPVCGASLPAYNSSPTGQGRLKRYCSPKCFQQVARAREIAKRSRRICAW